MHIGDVRDYPNAKLTCTQVVNIRTVWKKICEQIARSERPEEKEPAYMIAQYNWFIHGRAFLHSVSTVTIRNILNLRTWNSPEYIPGGRADWFVNHHKGSSRK